jgi:hypothetical protein
MRKPWAFIAARPGSLLKPRYGFIELLFLDEISADVVVGIAELGIELDSAMAFRDGSVSLP